MPCHWHGCKNGEIRGQAGYGKRLNEHGPNIETGRRYVLRASEKATNRGVLEPQNGALARSGGGCDDGLEQRRRARGILGPVWAVEIIAPRRLFWLLREPSDDTNVVWKAKAKREDSGVGWRLEQAAASSRIFSDVVGGEPDGER